MKEFRFEGHSDDTFGEYGVTNDDYDNCASGRPIRWKLSDPQGFGYFITGHYSPNHTGCWAITVEPIDEDLNPQWAIKFDKPDRHYSQCLVVVAPDDAELVCLEREGDE